MRYIFLIFPQQEISLSTEPCGKITFLKKIRRVIINGVIYGRWHCIRVIIAWQCKLWNWMLSPFWYKKAKKQSVLSVCILNSVCILYPVCSLHFVPSLHFVLTDSQVLWFHNWVVRRFWIINLPPRAKWKYNESFDFRVEWFASTNDAHLNRSLQAYYLFPHSSETSKL